METELLGGLTWEPGSPIAAKSWVRAGPKGKDKQSALEVTVELGRGRGEKPGGEFWVQSPLPLSPWLHSLLTLAPSNGGGLPTVRGSPSRPAFRGQVPGSSEALPSRVGWLGGGSHGVSARTGG